MTSALLSPITVGAYSLAHRVVMAPLTRMRARQPGNVPHDLNAEYYGQRATSGGLLIAEATQVAQSGQGYPSTPGIHSEDQIAGWRRVTSAVHARGGRIFLQLWHVGRISHSSFQPDGGAPIAPSPIAPAGTTFTAAWTQVPYETPRALATDEIPSIIAAFRDGARHALAAGFDGVEIHGANGYLIEQFLQSRTNQRTDRYGGSVVNRVRLLAEIAEAVIGVAGAPRVGVRLSPFCAANDSGEPDPMPLYIHALATLAELGVSYLHLIEPRATGTGRADVHHANMPLTSELFRDHWPRVLIAAGGYDAELAERAVASGRADAVAFGRAFISNPDLVDRVRTGAPFAAWNRATFYGGDAAGYTDYPRLPTDAAAP